MLVRNGPRFNISPIVSIVARHKKANFILRDLHCFSGPSGPPSNPLRIRTRPVDGNARRSLRSFIKFAHKGLFFRIQNVSDFFPDCIRIFPAFLVKMDQFFVVIVDRSLRLKNMATLWYAGA